MNDLADIRPAQPAILVNTSRFRAAHEDEWHRLDSLLKRIERRSVRALSDDDLLALPLLYRSALSSLSVARETSLDKALVTYLEQLCIRAYFQLYGVPTSPGRQIVEFFLKSWPASIRALWRETVFCVLLTIAAAFAGYWLVISDPSWFYGIIPDGMAQGRDPTASVETLRESIYDSQNKAMLSTFATYLFTHNSQVALFAFALGFAFGVPTVLLLLYNGLSLGAMLAVFAQKGLGIGFAGWLSIHGSTELFAITLAGAAGLHIGSAVAFPGKLERLEAAVTNGRRAATAMAGVVCMLLVAGLLEGIGRQIILNDAARFGIGGAMLAAWLAYYYLPRRKERAHALASQNP